MMFKNRTEAGLMLAKQLKDYANSKKAIIVTIPRGGLPLGYAISKKLNLPLDIVLSKKIGHPLHKEFAIGAVTFNNIVLRDDTVNVSKNYVEEETAKIRDLLKQRSDRYYGNNKPLSLKDKIIILVDDGVATGQTLISSIELIAEQHPQEIIVALPVGPPSTIKKIDNLPAVKETICLLKPHNFQAVGQFYKVFNQVDDKEVIRLLNAANLNMIRTK